MGERRTTEPFFFLFFDSEAGDPPNPVPFPSGFVGVGDGGEGEETGRGASPALCPVPASRGGSSARAIREDPRRW